MTQWVSQFPALSCTCICFLKSKGNARLSKVREVWFHRMGCGLYCGMHVKQSWLSAVQPGLLEFAWIGSALSLERRTRYVQALKALDEFHNTIQYNTIQYNTIQYNTIQYNNIPMWQYSIVQCSHYSLSQRPRFWLIAPAPAKPAYLPQK